MNDPNSFQKLAISDEISEGDSRPFKLDGHRMALIRHEGKFLRSKIGVPMQTQHLPLAWLAMEPLPALGTSPSLSCKLENFSAAPPARILKSTP